ELWVPNNSESRGIWLWRVVGSRHRQRYTKIVLSPAATHRFHICGRRGRIGAVRCHFVFINLLCSNMPWARSGDQKHRQVSEVFGVWDNIPDWTPSFDQYGDDNGDASH